MQELYPQLRLAIPETDAPKARPGLYLVGTSRHTDEEATALLDERREKIAAHLGELDAVPADVRRMHLAIEYLHRFYSGELEWLDEVIGRLSTARPARK